MSKLRVIQSNDRGFVANMGDKCYSKTNSFTSLEPREVRLTLFILKKKDGTVDVSVFESVWSGEKDEDGQNIFVCISTPTISYDVDTKVHLMSSLDDKMELVSSVLN